MQEWKKYFEINQRNWDKRVDSHWESEFYDVEGFKKGNLSLRQIELDELGDVKNKSLLHLQCHFGLDTLSWARLGAKVTGVDFSSKAIAVARKLAKEVGIPAEFIECSVYDLPTLHQQNHDIVFTSYGTIGWLPNLDLWAEVVAESLRSGGTFFIADFHPFVWTLEEPNFQSFKNDYFNTDVIQLTEESTYADRNNSLNIENVRLESPIERYLSIAHQRRNRNSRLQGVWLFPVELLSQHEVGRPESIRFFHTLNLEFRIVTVFVASSIEVNANHSFFGCQRIPKLLVVCEELL